MARDLDTARLAFGAADPWPALDNVFDDRAREPAQNAEVRGYLRAWSGPGALVLVSHGVNITPLTGIYPAEGEVVVLRPDPAADFRVVVDAGHSAYEPGITSELVAATDRFLRGASGS